ncbi:G patch domain-containing protein 1 [Clonorchis sinensis]|uniref:G patch domain-containing protein 1 n=1 Tax=Clonorchis sinensis TaxID=79923 RepID=A0A3R7FE81_CLOSI|nr:G patch domain-containing protein 1 [Clonorchis sinensis]
MASWNEGEEGDNWVTYGAAFSDDETDEGRFRALQYGKRRPVPTAYEQRVLNERGRPLRFHGAFTGGFSAGYFNTVGSKEGFQPQSFHSSRKTRQRDAKEQAVQRPEDFMDEEDFGEHGIAPRRIKMSHTFDDTHIRDTLKVALGGQSVIPGAGSILKDLIVLSRGPLADRLLRKLGWKDKTYVLDAEEADQSVGSTSLPETTEAKSTSAKAEASGALLYTKICFDAKANTFGLGYSGLNPDVAMGRRQPTLAGRHPEESAAALLQRHGTIQSGFDPRAGQVRAGIRGQAFGVGALEVEDEDVYTCDQLADYDWEIGGAASEGEDNEDDEEAEMEAARLGRWSKSSGARHSAVTPKVVRKKTFDGWTAPSSKSGARQSGGFTGVATIPGFTIGSDASQLELFAHDTPVIRLPPGYMPVFNPLCVRDPTVKLEVDDAPLVDDKLKLVHPTKPLDAVARGRLLDEAGSGSVFDLMDPVERLRMEAAAAGLPVPPVSNLRTPTSETQPPVTSVMKPEALLKPFKTDPAKQARFEAFQVLIRRGFTPEVAYTRCSGAVDMTGEERERELNAFNGIMRASKLSTPSTSPVPPEPSPHPPTPDSVSRPTPLSSQLPPHKQQLVASLLSSRFRSAGCMDISKELTESEEKAQRAMVESLETVEPRDHAVATESYGALTRRRLTWHPDRVLCKRVNVPHPYPDSTFVGCPDERRPRNPLHRRRFGRGRVNDSSKNFSLFDLLDVNRGLDQGSGKVDRYGDDEEFSESDGETTKAGQSTAVPNAEDSAEQNQLSSSTDAGKPAPARGSMSVAPSRGPSIFACLFEAAEAAQEREATLTDAKPESKEAHEQSLPKPAPSAPRRLGPHLPQNPQDAEDADEQPSMDLFKSIFASDEELSPSESEGDGADNATTLNDSDLSARPTFSNLNNAHSDQASSLFAHLFEPTGDANNPLSLLSHITSQPKKADSTKTLANSGPDTDFYYGPALPPSFVASSTSPSEINSTPVPEAWRTPVSSHKREDNIEWTDSTQSTVDRDNKKRKHTGKHGKHKHRRKHKRTHKHSKSDKHKSARSSPSSYSADSDSTG